MVSVSSVSPRARALRLGAVAATASVVLGAGMVAAPAPAHADVLGDIAGAILNNGAAQGVLSTWGIDACGNGAKGSAGKADCTQGTGNGVAVVLPGTIKVIPLNQAKPEGSAKVIGSGTQFALAQTGGNATAISYLPLSLATAGASGGRTAMSFALIGMANAWTTDSTTVSDGVLNVVKITVPGIKSVSCFGMLTAAYAEDAGACVNVLGTFDGKLNLTKSLPELQLGLTNPVGAFMNPQDVLTEFIGNVFSGNEFNPATLFTDDIARLSIGGDNLLALTSDYGLQPISNTSGAIALSWLGGTIYLMPAVTVNGKIAANALGLPKFDLDGLGDMNKIVPTLRTGKIKTPVLGTTVDGLDTGSVTSGLGTQQLTSSSLASPSTATSSPATRSRGTGADLDGAASSDEVTTDPVTTDPVKVDPVTEGGTSSEKAPSDDAVVN
ncbi:hypothetical protein [Gordonia sp. (in: high G+C Gram-positive bacteria)]|uniref:hypothetical protein n=1 Tax=Gordonia sp. (in: high G+C Gram-positive bacteria) TaxID=84139 RepID=UPI003527FA73